MPEAGVRRSLATCHLCEALCGIVVEHDGRRVLSVRGDADDPFSRGHVCPKAAALGDVHDDPDRVRHPLRRTPSGGWEEIGWDEALAEASGRIHEIQRRHGRDAVAVFAGNPVAHNLGALLYGPLLLQSLGTRNVFTSNSVDGLPRLVVSRLMYGSFLLIPVPDLGRTRHLLLIGANPAVSNGSVMTAPGCKRRLKEIRERGGRIVVLDPRRTETAALADEHHHVRPGSDARLLLAMLQVIFAEGLARPDRGGLRCTGVAQIAEAVRRFTPEGQAGATGVPAETIRRLARDFATADSAACYGRMGTSVQEQGSLTTWLMDVLNLVTGNLDRPGGAMFSTPAADLVRLSSLAGQPGTFGRWRSRVSGLPEFHGELPVAAMAEEMETPGKGQVRALVVAAGNPVLSCPNGRRIERALPGLDLVVAIDIYRNETTRHAHLLLPPTFGLERSHYGLLGHMLGVEDAARFAPALLEAPAGVRHEWEIVTDLARGVLRRRGLAGRAMAALLSFAPRPETLLDLLLSTGPHGRFRRGGKGLSLRKLAASPHGIHLGELRPRLRHVLGRRPVTAAPPELLDALGRLPTEAAPAPELTLIGRRHLLSNNSWMHNVPRLNKGSDRCTLQVHPEDAARRGFQERGGRVRVASRVGTVDVPLEITTDVMPGVVSLPHGHGHDREGAALAVAAARPGASANDLTDDAVVDPLSGCAVLSGVPVSLAPSD